MVYAQSKEIFSLLSLEDADQIVSLKYGKYQTQNLAWIFLPRTVNGNPKQMFLAEVALSSLYVRTLDIFIVPFAVSVTEQVGIPYSEDMVC